MQIGTRLSVHQNLHILQPRRSSFKSLTSPLKPTSCSLQALRAPSATEVTRKHIANLEKLLHKKKTPDGSGNYQQHVLKNSSSETPGSRGRALLDGLDTARIWPEMKAAEEMSPRNLNRLKRLLSMNQEYSPRNNLGNRWREYHGSNDWAGLLDPLDENLRREIVRYGEFIQAAYHGFHSDPAMSAAPSPRRVALPDRSFKVTKSLYATSAVGLPDWVDDVAPHLGWMTQRSSWIGYVAVCDDRREIQRMGRREIVIALRGTGTCLEWAENMRAQLVPVSDKSSSDQPDGGLAKVECGFKSLYETSGAYVESLAESVVEEIKKLTEMYKGETLSITVTGHSLGAALALLVANELSTCAKDVPPVAVFSFGGPQVGNKAFAKQIISNNVKVLRIVNNQDVITRVPGVFLSEDLRKKLKNLRVMNMLEKLPLAYSHVGTELRVDTKMSPYLKPNADIACCHDLEAYLHLVDGYLSSNCPFRSNAKRSLARLLNDQRANVKKLYTSNAKALSLSVEKAKIAMPSCLPSPS